MTCSFMMQLFFLFVVDSQCWFQVYSTMIQLYTYPHTHSFSYSPYRLSQNSEYSFLCYKVSPCFYLMCVCESLSHVRLFATPWTVAHQAPLSMGFSRQEYWSGLPFPSPGNLPDSGIERRSPALQADTLPFEPVYVNVESFPSHLAILID